MVCRCFAGARTSDLDVGAADSEGQGNRCDCPGPAQGPGCEGIPGGRDQSHGSGVDSAPACECDSLFGQGFFFAAECELAERACPGIANGGLVAHTIHQNGERPESDSVVTLVDWRAAVCFDRY